jgi:hypothetical protein
LEVVAQANRIAQLIQENRRKLWQKDRQQRYRDDNPTKVCVDLHGRMGDPSGQDV